MNRYRRTRRDFLKTVGLGAAAVVTPGLLSAAAPSRKPNVVLVITDDQGYADLACYGNAKKEKYPLCKSMDGSQKNLYNGTETSRASFYG